MSQAADTPLETRIPHPALALRESKFASQSHPPHVSTLSNDTLQATPIASESSRAHMTTFFNAHLADSMAETSPSSPFAASSSSSWSPASVSLPPATFLPTAPGLISSSYSLSLLGSLKTKERTVISVGRRREQCRRHLPVVVLGLLPRFLAHRDERLHWRPP